MSKYLILAMSVVSLTACASVEKKAKKVLFGEVASIVEHSQVFNEPCNVTCGKLKAALERYKATSK